jgi:hypothetical protein
VVCSQFSTLKRIVMESDAVSALTEVALHHKSNSNDVTIIDYKGLTPSSNPGIVTLKKRLLPAAALALIEEVDRASKQP